MAPASRGSEKGHWTRSASPLTPLLLGLDPLKCPEAPGEDQQAETTGVQNHVSTACAESPPLEMPPVPRRQARTSSPPDPPRIAGSALRTQQVSARTQGAALHPPASLPEDKATARPGSGHCPHPGSAGGDERPGGGGQVVVPQAVIWGQSCNNASALCLAIYGVGGSPHLPRGTPGSHNLPELQPQGHKPRASSVAKGEMFQVPFSAKKVHRPAGPGAERGACAGRRGPGAVSATCFLLPDCAMPSSEAGKTGEGGQHAEGCCLADQRVQHGTPLFSCRTGSPG